MEALLFDGRDPGRPAATTPGWTSARVIVGSMSKAYRMIGWRVGWVAGAGVGGRATRAGSTPTTPTGNVSVARRAAEAVLRGAAGARRASPSPSCERRRDAIFAALPDWPLVRPAGGWSLLVDVAAMGLTPAEASARMLAAGVAATGMTGWGDEVAARHVRFVFSAEPVPRLATLGERLAHVAA